MTTFRDIALQPQSVNPKKRKEMDEDDLLDEPEKKRRKVTPSPSNSPNPSGLTPAIDSIKLRPSPSPMDLTNTTEIPTIPETKCNFDNYPKVMSACGTILKDYGMPVNVHSALTEYQESQSMSFDELVEQLKYGGLCSRRKVKPPTNKSYFIIRYKKSEDGNRKDIDGIRSEINEVEKVDRLYYTIYKNREWALVSFKKNSKDVKKSLKKIEDIKVINLHSSKNSDFIHNAMYDYGEEKMFNKKILNSIEDLEKALNVVSGCPCEVTARNLVIWKINNVLDICEQHRNYRDMKAKESETTTMSERNDHDKKRKNAVVGPLIIHNLRKG